MEGCVNVNFLWGGRIIRREDGDITYSTEPNYMRYVMLGTNYEELKAIVYETMNISPYHWNVKLSYKYPQIGIGNVVKGYYLAQITSDVDVARLLSIPRTMQMGLGDVSMRRKKLKLMIRTPMPIIQILSLPNQVIIKSMGRASRFPNLEQWDGLLTILAEVSTMRYFRDCGWF